MLGVSKILHSNKHFWLLAYEKKSIVIFRVVRATKMTGSSSDDLLALRLHPLS
jgi:hypothetical protein